MEITEQQRISIIKFIVAQPLFLGDLGKEEGGIVEFLEMIWELRAMPSTDDRFHTAYEDAWQHLVRNDDWEYEYVFLDRFTSTYRNIDIFKKFVSFSVHPSLFNNEEERRQLIEIINAELAKVGFTLIGTDYFEQRIVYSLAPTSEVLDQLPENIAANTIPIYFGQDGQRQYPCLELVPDE